ncbi:MAG: hypothetical protein ACYC1C_04335 [Chloroflexota bacterium]
MAVSTGLAKVTEFWRVLRDVNPAAINRELEKGFTLALLGSDEPGKAAVRRALRSVDGASAKYLVEIDELTGPDGRLTPPRADLYLYVVDANAGLSGQDITNLEQLYLLARPTALIFAGNGCGSLAGELEQVSSDLGGLVSMTIAVDPSDLLGAESHVGSLLVRTLPNKALAMARHLAPLRSDTAEEIIRQTTRVNAEFALLSNLPANIPVLGTLMGAGADLLVLTKNQAMMVLKLAAVYGRDLDDKWRLAAEIIPVIGAAFAWRTIARLVVGTLPTPIAALPKTAIAYAGTVVVGKMAKYYFEYGQKPSPAVTQQFAREAAKEWQRVAAGAANS